MPEQNLLTVPSLVFDLAAVFSVMLVIAAALYFVFSLIVLRQINLMTETVQTEGAPIIRAFGFLHAGVALGVVLLFIGWLF